jgi:hypothetical protein
VNACTDDDLARFRARFLFLLSSRLAESTKRKTRRESTKRKSNSQTSRMSASSSSGSVSLFVHATQTLTSRQEHTVRQLLEQTMGPQGLPTDLFAGDDAWWYLLCSHQGGGGGEDDKGLLGCCAYRSGTRKLGNLALHPTACQGQKRLRPFFFAVLHHIREQDRAVAACPALVYLDVEMSNAFHAKEIYQHYGFVLVRREKSHWVMVRALTHLPDPSTNYRLLFSDSPLVITPSTTVATAIQSKTDIIRSPKTDSA